MMVLRTSVAFLASALAFLPICGATGATYVIQPDGLGDYATIQEAILAAGDGDVIELTDGTFGGDGNRDIMVPSRDLTIRSQSGDPMACVIDCEGSARAEHRGFYFEAAVGTGDVLLDGIGVMNGYTTGNGGGLIIEGADTMVENCIIAQCTSDGSLTRGGGVYVSSSSSPHFVDCIITGCTAGYGGGVNIYQAGGVFESCTVIDNSATAIVGGVYMQSARDCHFSECSIVSNEAPRIAGVRASNSTSYVISFEGCSISRNLSTYGDAWGLMLYTDAIVTNCTIVENVASFGVGAGVYCFGDDCELTRCIIAYTENGFGIAASAEGNEPTLTCCDVYGNADGDYDAIVGDQTGVNNNFSLPPGLCDRENGDYRLFDTSPCLATASPCGLLVGAYDQGCDSPVEHMSWGAIKVLYQ
ncbi:MAG: right-handed parallel beta-helix repeat-containing protein [Candidatus Eisenbacteria bacterium]|nr:right-handed parallel beta-helix repeat-containing protein [Candidatus Eisenbacteria bacterium]